MIPDWGRRLAIVTAAVFFVSLVLPVAAGLSHNTATFPKWWGALDVSVALVLAALALVILGFSQGR